MNDDELSHSYFYPLDPARNYPKELEEQIKASAKAIFRVLNCRSLSRVDFFLNRDTGDLVFNEINTLPGFTNISMYPMLAAKHGLDLPTLIDTLVTSVLN